MEESQNDFPFLFKLMIMFFFVDALEKVYFLIQSYSISSQFKWFTPHQMLYLIVAAFNFLLVTQLYLKIKLLRIWLTFYLILNMAYQCAYFVHIAPQEWFILSETQRVFQCLTVVFNLGILWYIHTPECVNILVE